MKPQNQLRLTTDGDCLRACLASLLEFPIAQVPDFTALEGDVWLHVQTWLYDQGFFFLEIRLEGEIGPTATNPEPQKLVTVWNPLPYAALCLIVGPTKDGTNHIVVGICEGDQFKPQFDPFPGGSGITRAAAVCFVVPRDPFITVRMGRSLERIGKAAGKEPRDIILRSIKTEAYEGLGIPIEEAPSIITP